MIEESLNNAIKRIQKKKKMQEASGLAARMSAAYTKNKDLIKAKKGLKKPKKGGALATTKGSDIKKTGSSALTPVKDARAGITKPEPEAKDQTIDVKATEVGGDLAKGKSKVGSMSNSGKKEVDPSKNDVTRNKTNKQQGPKRKPLKYNSPDRDISKDVDPDSAEKRKDRMDQKNKSRAQSLKKNTGRVIKKTGQMAKSGVQTYTGAFGTSSFSKEGITFKNYLNKL